MLQPGRVILSKNDGDSYETVHQFQLTEVHDGKPGHMRITSQEYFCGPQEGPQEKIVFEHWGMWGKTRFDDGPPHSGDGRDHESTIYVFDEYVNGDLLAGALEDGDVVMATLTTYSPCSVKPKWDHLPSSGARVIRELVDVYRQDENGSWSPIRVPNTNEPMCSLNVSGRNGKAGCYALDNFKQVSREPYLWEQGDLGNGPIAPPPPEPTVVAYLGGSITRNAVKGWHSILGDSVVIPWPYIEKYGGMTIHRWGAPEEHRKWKGLFAEAQTNDPADILWLHILPRPLRFFGSLTSDEIIELKRVLERIDKYAPTVSAIFASPIPKFENTCPVTDGCIQASYDMVEYGAEQGWWSYGPILAPVTKKTSNFNDPCHQNEAGQLVHGENLKDFFV